MTVKQCTKCSESKPDTDFYRKTPTRLMAWCKACHSIVTRANLAKLSPEAVQAIARRTYEKRRPAILAKAKQHRLDNLDAERAKNRAYDASHAEARKAYKVANAERIRQKMADYRVANADRIKASDAAYRAERKLVLAERQREWRLLNPEAYLAIHSRWKKANKAKVNAATHRRRAIIRGCSEHYTAAEWEALKVAAGHTCLWCGRSEPEISLCVDHVIPVSKGGPNDIGNIQPLCFSCNSKKHTKDTDFRLPKVQDSDARRIEN